MARAQIDAAWRRFRPNERISPPGRLRKLVSFRWLSTSLIRGVPGLKSVLLYNIQVEPPNG